MVTNPHESEAKRSACHSPSTTTIRDRWPASSAESHSIRRILCPPGYLCRIARMQASDHLGHSTKFRETGEEIATSCPQPRLSRVTLCLHDEAQATAMKTTAGARKVNMADEKSRRFRLVLKAISSRPHAD